MSDPHLEALPPKAVRPLVVALLLTSSMFVLELVGGLWARSLALVADAVHMAVDLVALCLGLFAVWICRLPPDDRRTFGYHRVEVLAALGNGVGLWITVGVLLREAYGRVWNPPHVRLLPMSLIAAAGLVCNMVSGAILYRHSRDSINMRAVFLHVMSDALGSLGAITAALVIWRTGWLLADPLATVFICLIISVASFKLVRDSIHILLEGAPAHLDLDVVREALEGLEGVSEVHDLHLWSISCGNESLSGHLVVEEGRDSQKVLKAGGELLEKSFGIRHVTLQIEVGAKGER